MSDDERGRTMVGGARAMEIIPETTVRYLLFAFGAITLTALFRHFCTRICYQERVLSSSWTGVIRSETHEASASMRLVTVTLPDKPGMFPVLSYLRCSNLLFLRTSFHCPLVWQCLTQCICCSISVQMKICCYSPLNIISQDGRQVCHPWMSSRSSSKLSK